MQSNKTQPNNTEFVTSDTALKSFFLGPQAENQEWLENSIHSILHNWFAWRKSITPEDGPAIFAEDMQIPDFKVRQKRTEELINKLSHRFEQEIPKFSPRYVGHMLSEISMPALLGHILTLLHNPNNVSQEASKVGVQIENEAIELLCRMVGYRTDYGHFTSGGTVANIESMIRARDRLALWLSLGMHSGSNSYFESAHMGWDRAIEYMKTFVNEDYEKYNFVYHNPWQVLQNFKTQTKKEFKGPVVLVPQNKHYSWPKSVHMLGLGDDSIRYIELDKYGHASSKALKTQIEQSIKEERPIAQIVGVLGTTELGSFDPIHDMLNVIESYKKEFGFNFWFHIDGAYGGYFRSVRSGEWEKYLSVQSLKALEATGRSQSITIDPHKLGYVPYSSGVFLCRDEQDYFIKSFMGPYIETSKQNRGNFTLEGSRSAAGAVATWLSMYSIGVEEGYGRILGRSLWIKSEFEAALENKCPRALLVSGLDSNIICFALKSGSNSLKDVNENTLKAFQSFQSDKKLSYWLSKTTLKKESYGELISGFCEKNNLLFDCSELNLVRITLMNPFIITKESKIDHVANFCDRLNQE